MLFRHFAPVRDRRPRRLALLLAAPRAAQDAPPAEFQSWRLPGWTFTPGVIVRRAPTTPTSPSRFPPADTGKTASDKLFEIEPFGQLEYFSPRTMFSSGYHGFVRRYVDFNELDGARSPRDSVAAAPA